MALSSPFTTAVLADLLRMSSVRLKLIGDQQLSGLGAGKIIVADLSPKYWEFEVSLINMENALASQVQGLIEALDEGINDFYLYDPRRAYPAADWGGTRLGGATVQIASLDSNNKELTLKGLPNGYVLSPGDMFHFDFGTPTKRALHRIVNGGTVPSGGVSPTLEVRPHILPGAAVDAAVSLIKPAARCKMIPGSFDPGTARLMHTAGMAFKARQILV